MASFVFLVIALVMVVAAVMAVTKNNLVHAAMALVVVLFGTAALFVLLEAYFLAVAQVIIYVGAIAILIVFAIMLTRRVGADWGRQTNLTWPWALVLSAALGGLLFAMGRGFAAAHAAEPEAVPAASLKQLGQALVDPNGFVVAFELASVLLLAALIGAVYIAWGGPKADRQDQA